MCNCMSIPNGVQASKKFYPTGVDGQSSGGPNPIQYNFTSKLGKPCTDMTNTCSSNLELTYGDLQSISSVWI